MNKRIAIVGASGVLGQELLSLSSQFSYAIRSIIRNEDKKHLVEPLSQDVWIGDANHPEELTGCFEGIDTVISTVGKSISLFVREPQTFAEIDYQANLNLLQEAQRAGVKHFMYVSIFASETSPKLRQGWMQEKFSQELIRSGLPYTIIKPVGLFSGLNDLVTMGKSGLLLTPGDGSPKTNPIHQRDLAQFCWEHLSDANTVLEVGGPEIHSRQEVAELVCQMTKCRFNLNVPLFVVKPGLKVVRLLGKNIHDKLSFFTYITTHDMVAPVYGQRKYETYLREEENLT